VILKAYKLAQEIAAKRLRPLYFFYGDEVFMQEESCAAIRRAHLGEGDTALTCDRVDGGELTAHSFATMAQGMALFGDRRLVIVRDADDVRAAEADGIAAALDNLPDGTIIIFRMTTAKPAKSSSLVKKLFAAAGVTQFYPPDGGKVAAWARGYVRKRGAAINDDALAELLETAGSNVRIIETEVDKCLTYAAGRKRITSEDVLALSGQSREYNIFDLGAHLQARDIVAGLRCLRGVLSQQKNAEMLVLSHLATVVRKLALGRLLMDRTGMTTEQISKIIGLHRYFDRDFFSHVRQFRFDELCRNVRHLVDAEYTIKTGRGEAPVILSALWLSLCGR